MWNRGLVLFLLTASREASGYTNSGFFLVSSTLRSEPSNYVASRAAQSQAKRRLFLTGATEATTKSDKLKKTTSTLTNERQMIEPNMLFLALAPPVLAFLIWGEVSRGVAFFFDTFQNFQAVGT